MVTKGMDGAGGAVNSFSNGNQGSLNGHSDPCMADWYAGNTDPRILHHWAARR